MDPVNVEPMIEELEENIDDLEVALSTLLNGTLSDTANKFPVLDRAQLYVTAAWSIESILFSYLRLNGVDAKEHPVYRELTRVKQYFDKIKDAETSDSQRPANLDKPAAGRFIKHALAGNDEYDRRRARLQAGEKARAHIKFEEMSKKRKRDEAGKQESNLDLKTSGASKTSNDPATHILASKSTQAEPESESSHEDSSNKSSSEQAKPELEHKNKKRRRQRHRARKEEEPPQNDEPKTSSEKLHQGPNSSRVVPISVATTAASPGDKAAVGGNRKSRRRRSKKNKPVDDL